MKKYVLFYLLVISLTACNTEARSGKLVTDLNIRVQIEEVPKDKIKGDVVWVIRLKSKGHPYKYLPDSDSTYAHYKAILE